MHIISNSDDIIRSEQQLQISIASEYQKLYNYFCIPVPGGRLMCIHLSGQFLEQSYNRRIPQKT